MVHMFQSIQRTIPALAVFAVLGVVATQWGDEALALPLNDLAAPAVVVPSLDGMGPAPRYHGPQTDNLALLTHRLAAVERQRISGRQVDNITRAVREAGEAYNVDPKVLLAIAWRESRFRTNAVGDHGRSCGAFQIRTDIAGRPSCRRMQDFNAAARYAAFYLDWLRRHCDYGDYIAAYNGGCRGRNFPGAQRYQRTIRALSVGDLAVLQR